MQESPLGTLLRNALSGSGGSISNRCNAPSRDHPLDDPAGQWEAAESGKPAGR
ncbi:hypothetical protein HKX54_15735 [Sulfitobacter sp. M57]|uniref:hypothetical protein n=1 Tax=unclassified Sulfitobacter TaxID=196795 RepID=UPI0023E25306|nr:MULTISPECIES: hypothetical protein [unclassified Sulfitobacter]MDF3415920.1 hypothetical protein [Sulfitobacter sp. KE5]MDF3423400.1 hypothetical protein [Sulfitobacter sp. KE43]MDF3434466.1 hypothetical protein [Sulfitobacter sp. KE42]MDF3460106.1 hypothetical protein [Sulfitobacter sp. S74]MDF3464004.1 hypothetical protein [Sulfitobacter sp. Ks18]